MPVMPAGYHNRFDKTKNPETHLFRAGYCLQAAELNEIQSAAEARAGRLGEALFKPGDIVSGCALKVTLPGGQATAEAGRVFIAGTVHDVPARTFTVPVTGVVDVGIYMDEVVVTELEDPSLRDPATGARNYQEPGAARLRKVFKWSYLGDNSAGTFVRVYQVRDGVVQSKAPPPQMDSVSQAISRYDVDNSGGMYVVEGLSVRSLLNDGAGNQVYSVSSGRARVNGNAVLLTTDRRVVYPAAPDLETVYNEPHTSTSLGGQRINVNRGPLHQISECTITAEKTVTVTRGGALNTADLLPDTTVSSILEVKQGVTTFANGADYALVSGQVSWTPGGNEPAPGSSYTVKYQYISNITPTGVDLDGFTVTGAVVGTPVFITYSYRLPRYDRLCMAADGSFTWARGVPAYVNPSLPAVPAGLLLLATVYQRWRNAPAVNNDGIRMVPMGEIRAISARLDWLTLQVSRQALFSDVHAREAGAKQGMFVDPFIDNSQRDAGQVQTAAVVDGILGLSISAQVLTPTGGITSPQTTPYTHGGEDASRFVLRQLFQTREQKINPYSGQIQPPARLTLSPPVDQWTEITDDIVGGTVTERFVVRFSSLGLVEREIDRSEAIQLIGSNRVKAQFARQIPVTVTLEGMGPGETVSQVFFDGQLVNFN